MFFPPTGRENIRKNFEVGTFQIGFMLILRIDFCYTEKIELRKGRN